MGCNAWNHPPGCGCGWGGIHHDSSEMNNSNHWCMLGSYTNPNALCPVCGTKVFFYKSPFGGRVYFDRLGPPWPKHSCTRKDLDANYILPKYKKVDLENQEKKSEWLPFICSSVRHKSGKFIEIIVENQVGIFPKILYAKGDKLISTKYCPLFIRKIKSMFFTKFQH